MASSRTRLQTSKVFLLSGIEDQERKLLAKLIQDLGGLYLNADSFRTNCTHVICGKLSRSEKFLGACSMGKWVLHPEYIKRSAENGQWMQEEPFEWSNFQAQNIPCEMRTAGSRWRFHNEVFQSLPFTGWNAAVVVTGVKKCSVYRRLLACGGARVYNLKLPVKDMAKVADTLTYIFVNDKNAASVLHLVEYGILCLRPEYIGDYLVKDPTPDPMDYLVQSFTDTDVSMIDINCSQQNTSVDHIPDTPNLSDITIMGIDDMLEVRSSSPTSKHSSSKAVRTRLCLEINSTPSSRCQSPESDGFIEKMLQCGTPSPFKSAAIDTVKDYFKNKGDTKNWLKPSPVQTRSRTRSGRNTPNSDTSSESPSNKIKKNHVQTRSGRSTPDSDISAGSPYNSTWNSGHTQSGGYSDTFVGSQYGNIKTNARRNTQNNDSLTEDLHVSFVTVQTRSGRNTPNSDQSPNIHTRSKRNTGISSNPDQSLTVQTKSGKITPTLEQSLTIQTRSGKNTLNSDQSLNIQTRSRRNTPNSDHSLNVQTRSGRITPSSDQITDIQSPKLMHIMNHCTRNTNSLVTGSSSKEEVNIIERSIKNKIVPTTNVSPGDRATSETRNNRNICEKTESDGNSLNMLAEDPIPLDKDSSEIGTPVETLSMEPKTTPTGAVVMTLNVKPVNNVAQNNNSNKNVTSPVKKPNLSPLRIPSLTPVQSPCVTQFSTENVKEETPDKCIMETGDECVRNATSLQTPSETVVESSCKPIIYDSTVEMSDSDTQEDINTTSTSHLVSTPNIPTKRKGENDGNGVLKKKKIHEDKYHWCPVVTTFNSLLSIEDLESEQKIEETPVQFSTSLTGIIQTCLDESTGHQFVLAGIDIFKSSLSIRKYPHASILCILMNKILLGPRTTGLIASRTYCALMKLLQLHPPISLVAINLYNQSFVYNEYSEGQDWEFFKNVIGLTVNFDIPRYNGISLLKYLVSILEQNYKFVLQRYEENPGSIQKIKSSMIAQLLWPSFNQIFFNRRCQDLVGFVGEVIFTDIPQGEKSEILKLLMSILGMAANICYLVENYPSWQPVNTAIFGKNVSTFLHEITKVINYNLDEIILKEILMMLQPSWFCLGVCCYMLSDYDDYLLIEGLPKGRISLKDVVTKYIYLLPKMTNKKTDSLTENRSPHRKRIKPPTPSTPQSPASSQRSLTSPFSSPQKIDPLSPASSANTPEKQRLQSLRLLKSINKKNFKGETSLHSACIKNDVVKLKQLLKAPGIDVNIQDNAGWTAMHEACNRGRVQCVQELLQFVPAKTVDHYFNKGGSKCKKVDLLIGNDDGISPLHDAVMNNRHEICHLLLQHAGAILLKQKTMYGYSPLDLAENDDLKDLLISYSDNQAPVTSSQESSQSQEDLPGSHLYDQVIGQGHKVKYSSVDDCVKYVSVISFLISSYITERFGSATEFTDYNVQTGNKENVTATRNKSSDEKEIFIKSDIKILKNFRKYVLRFEEHLMKICGSSDTERLNMELALLMCMENNCINCS